MLELNPLSPAKESEKKLTNHSITTSLVRLVVTLKVVARFPSAIHVGNVMNREKMLLTVFEFMVMTQRECEKPFNHHNDQGLVVVSGHVKAAA